MENDDFAASLPALSWSVTTSPASSFASFDMSDWDDCHHECFVNMDHITSVEREFFSDLVCCGQQMKDLHHLLDHRNECKSSMQSCLDSICVAHSQESQPRPNISCSSLSARQSSLTQPHNLNSTQTSASTAESHQEQPTTAESTTASPLEDGHTQQPTCDRPEIDGAVLGTLEAPLDSEIIELVQEAQDQPDVPPASGPRRPHKSTRKIRKGASSKIARARRRVQRELQAEEPFEPSPRKSQEKHHDRHRIHCTRTFGCTKSYLNPNGLKYHLEHGRCTVDERLSPLTDASDS